MIFSHLWIIYYIFNTKNILNMRSLLFLTVLFGLSTSLVQAQAVPYDLDLGRYHALIISNQHYKQLTPLKTPHGDADALANVLRNEYGFRVTALRDSNRAGTLDALDRMVEKLTPNDNLLIFYAGHGHLDSATGEGYWLPVTASPRRRSEWISNGDITDTLRATAAKHVLVISDSCFSGTLSRSASAGLNVGADKRNYYKKLVSRVSRTALSSGGLEPVDDGGNSGHSVFAGALISALQRNNEPLLEAESLYGQIKRPVALNSSATQKPQYSDVRATGHDEGDFLFFKRNIRPSPKPTVNNAAQSTTVTTVDTNAAYEMTFWNSIKDSKDARDFGAYLQTYPKGQFVALARLRTRQLSGKQAPVELPVADASDENLISYAEVEQKEAIVIAKAKPLTGQNLGTAADTVLLVLATPDSEYSPKFNNIAAYSNAVAEVVRDVIKNSTINYIADQKIARNVIEEDDEHIISKQLCAQYDAQQIMSIELDLSRDIEEITRTPDSVYVGVYLCEKGQYSLSEYRLDFRLGEEFAYAIDIRSSLKNHVR